MKNTLLIHLGTPKTGSSALQRFLCENRRNLENHGWCYPDLQGELPDVANDCSDNNGSIFFISRKKWTDLPKLRGDRNAIWSQILVHLKRQNVIISAENFFFCPEQFLKEAKQQYDNIKAVVYLRRQDRMAESYWDNWIRHGNAEAFQESIRHRSEFLVDYLKNLDVISEIVGKENLIVRVYEKQQFCGSNHTLESDFLSILGIEPNWEEWKPSPRLNASLRGNYVELRRMFNSVQSAYDTRFPPFLPVFVQLSERFSEGAAQGYFTEEERRAYLEQVASENEYIAREYLGRENGTLFYEDKTDYPVYDANCCSPFEADMFRVLSAMICDLHARMRRILQYTAPLAERFLLERQGERELLFFGAGEKSLEILENVTLAPAHMVDNNRAKKGKRIKGIEILHTADIDDWSKYFIVITPEKTTGIEAQLQSYGLKKEKDYILAKEYFIYDWR